MKGWDLGAGGGLFSRSNQFMHFNQPGFDHLIRGLTHSHSSAHGNANKDVFDIAASGKSHFMYQSASLWVTGYRKPLHLEQY